MTEKRTRWARPVLAGMALGAWMLAWGWAAEAHEPSQVGGAPSAISAGSLDGVREVPEVRESRSLQFQDRWGRRHRRSFWRREQIGWATLRGGVFNTDDVEKNDWLAGVKVTTGLGSYLEIGASADLQRRSQASRLRIEAFRDASGNPVRTTVTTFESASNLIPVLGVVELHLPTGPLQPYVGVGAGYEALVVEVRDFVTGVEYHDDFGGFGWQPYAGLGVPVARNARVVGEVFGNFATVSRTVRDIDTGFLVDQEIDVNGFGARAGVSIGF